MKKSQAAFHLTITDTLTGEKKTFATEEDMVGKDRKVGLYVCGITPYDYSHIGHGRCYVTFDLLYRLLRFLDYQVTYVRNYTDIDDKLINRAEQELGDPTRYLELSDRYIDAYQSDMQKLNCLSPHVEPRVTQHIPEIITFIEGLIAHKKAYVVGDDVYYRIASFETYGALSKRNIDDLIAGARIDVREGKENPLDFALWKSIAAQPGWESPWGLGRPGWHIECSTLSQKYLGDTIDIHGGGMDLMFPHHENERAQSEGLTGKQFVRFWMHNAFVNVNKEKMSKSLGNFVILRTLFESFDPMVIRYYYLVHHYRNPLEFSEQDIIGSAKSYKKLCQLFKDIPDVDAGQQLDACIEDMSIVDDFVAALCDDLNVARAIGIVFERLKELESHKEQAMLLKAIMQQVLGLTLEEVIEKQKQFTEAEQRIIDTLVRERQEARAAKNWAKADELRDKLLKMGYKIQDTKL